MPKSLAVLVAALSLSGCVAVYDVPTGPIGAPPPGSVPQTGASRPMGQAISDYRLAAARVEASATQLCLETHPTRPRRFCDFDFVLVDDPRIGPNAFQTETRDGRPVVAMTVQLAALTDNVDQIAFVLGHEAAHHISEHIAKTQSQAMTGALVLGTLATLGNAPDDVVSDMMDLGASLGGRAYSQDYETEADVLGAYVAARAGFDPERGAQVFLKPELGGGGGLLSTHPASAERQAVVRRVAAEIRRQQAAGLTPQPTGRVAAAG